MHTELDRLITLLDEEFHCYQKLLGCVQNEKQAIIGMDFDGLAAIGSQKEDTLLQLRRLSAQRTQALERLCEEMALSSRGLTLGQLSKKAPMPYADALRRCRERLLGVIGNLDRESTHVKQLVDHGLALVRGSAHMISRLLDDSPVYRASGNLQPAPATGRFHSSDY